MQLHSGDDKGNPDETETWEYGRGSTDVGVQTWEYEFKHQKTDVESCLISKP